MSNEYRTTLVDGKSLIVLSNSNGQRQRPWQVEWAVRIYIGGDDEKWTAITEIVYQNRKNPGE